MPPAHSPDLFRIRSQEFTTDSHRKYEALQERVMQKKALPCDGQTIETIHAWAQNLKVGDPVGLLQTYRHVEHEYRIGDVEEFTDRGRRVMVKGVGTFWRTANAAGKNCFHPNGQLSMVEPTPAVIEAAKSKRWYGGMFDGPVG